MYVGKRWPSCPPWNRFRTRTALRHRWPTLGYQTLYSNVKTFYKNMKNTRVIQEWAETTLGEIYFTEFRQQPTSRMWRVGKVTKLFIINREKVCPRFIPELPNAASIRPDNILYTYIYGVFHAKRNSFWPMIGKFDICPKSRSLPSQEEFSSSCGSQIILDFP